ncbi:hypothetical protein BDV95DRAFT_454573, partial [Massariosphaeria phaeospora]
RVKFLQEAAHVLAIGSPTTSAALGAARDRLLETQNADIDAPNKDWDALRRELCGACGSLMVPGWSCAVTRRAPPAKPSKKSKEDTSQRVSRPEKTVTYSCLRCGRKTIQSLPLRPPKHMKKAARKNASNDPQSTPDDPSRLTKAANASSKQRKKARKGGLQALLEKSKTQTSNQSGLGLELMDF